MEEPLCGSTMAPGPGAGTFVGMSTVSLHVLLSDVRACSVCEGLPLGPRPLLQGSASSKILIIGQAPGVVAHESGIPWNDKSGDRLRAWLGLDHDAFYDEDVVALMPMGFCYPGKGKSGDLPPRSECAPLWHERLLEALRGVELTICVGLPEGLIEK